MIDVNISDNSIISVPFQAVDTYRKQAIHALTSAKVAMCLLKGAPVTEQEKQRIFQIILRHDMTHPSFVQMYSSSSSNLWI